jgi:hypothetical protein
MIRARRSFSVLSADFVGSALIGLCVLRGLGVDPASAVSCAADVSAEGAESAETVFNAEAAEPAESFSTLSSDFVGSALLGLCALRGLGVESILRGVTPPQARESHSQHV